MLDRLRKLIEDRPTPVKDRLQAVVAQLFAGVVVASFAGCVLAMLLMRGC